jgi:UDP-2,3-diacylglucosamine hydrolase
LLFPFKPNHPGSFLSGWLLGGLKFFIVIHINSAKVSLMRFVTISDIHIKQAGDGPSQLFLKFLDSDEVKTSDEVYLLGDIFDILIGPYPEYLDIYNEIFEKIADKIKSGKTFFYFEGNHDFHITKLFEAFNQKFQLVNPVNVVRKHMYLESNGKKIRLSHGDDIEIGNWSYKAYKYFITSKPLALLADYIVPFSWVERIGVNASQKSRKRNKERYGHKSDQSHIRDKFRLSALRVFEREQANIIICGHSHVKDHYIGEDFIYLNNGYFPLSKSYIFVDQNKFEMIHLE